MKSEFSAGRAIAAYTASAVLNAAQHDTADTTRLRVTGLLHVVSALRIVYPSSQ